MQVPCGKCVGCLLDRRRSWAVRCMHEASVHPENRFLTLTYDEEHLPLGGSLEKDALAGFMKRLRSWWTRSWKEASDVVPPIRYFGCGEYGGRAGRPHYHALLFGFGFPDERPWARRKGHQARRSAVAEGLWPVGNVEIGDVTPAAAAYVAGYQLKKLFGREDPSTYVNLETGETVERYPEFHRMSRRPGIGQWWLEQFAGEVFQSDEVLLSGRLVKPPRFYMQKLEAIDAEYAAELKRRRAAAIRPEEQEWARLKVREMVALSGLNPRKGDGQ